MRIAFVTDEYVTEEQFDGGLANYLYRVALSLLQLGHEPIIFVGAVTDEVFLHKGIEVHRVKFSRSKSLKRLLMKKKHRFEWRSWKLNQAVKEVHRKKPFDIVQYASCNSVGLYRIKKVPCVVRFSSIRKLWFEAYESILTDELIKIEKMETESFRRADAIFGPSYVVGKEVEKAAGKPVTVIETPFVLDTVDLDESIYLENLAGKKYLLFFGRVELLKGVITIGDTIYDLLKQHPDLYFVFIGKNMPYQDATAIDYVIDKAGEYKDRVIYFGKLPHNQLYPIIKNAQAVVLPSRIDNFPNTCLEAMAHKKIVIGTDGASFEQLIENGVNGFLCKKDDTENLLDIINLVLGLTEEKKNKIEEKSYQRIQELRPEITVNKLVEFYQQVIQEYKLEHNL